MESLRGTPGRSTGPSATGSVSRRSMSRAASASQLQAQEVLIPDWKAQGVTTPLENGPVLRRTLGVIYASYDRQKGVHPQVHPSFIDPSTGRLCQVAADFACYSTPLGKEGQASWCDLANYGKGVASITADKKQTSVEAGQLVGTVVEWKDDQHVIVQVPETVVDGQAVPAHQVTVVMPLPDITHGFDNMDLPAGPGVVNPGINTAHDPVIVRRNADGDIEFLSAARADAHILDFKNLRSVLAKAGITEVPISITDQSGVPKIVNVSIETLTEALHATHIDFSAGIAKDGRGAEVKGFLEALFGKPVADQYTHGKQTNPLTSRLLIQLSKAVIKFAEELPAAKSNAELKKALLPFEQPVRAILGGGMDPNLVKNVKDPALASMSPVEQKVKMLNNNAANEFAEELGKEKGPESIAAVKALIRNGLESERIDARALGFIRCKDQRNTRNAMIMSFVTTVDVTHSTEMQAMTRQSKPTGFKIRLATPSGTPIEDDEMAAGDDVIGSKWAKLSDDATWFASHGDILAMIAADQIDKGTVEKDRLSKRKMELGTLILAKQSEIKTLPSTEARAIAVARQELQALITESETLELQMRSVSQRIARDEKVRAKLMRAIG